LAGAVEVVRRFRAIAEANDADEIVAYGTAALRAAANGAAAVERLEAETGVRVKVINGIREAQLIFEAVRASVLIDPGPALCADLGGGSLELSVGDRAGLVYATSVHLGVGRLTAELVRSDPPSPKDRSRLRRRVEEELAAVLPEIIDEGPRMLIGSSGTLCAIVRAAVALRDGTIPPVVNQLSASAKEVTELADLVCSLSSADRARLPGIDARRAELLPAGVAVAEVLMEETGFLELTASEWALREGMVLSAIGKHDRADLTGDPRAIRRASVLSLCRRSNWREAHGQAAAKLACQLFDATAAVHRLGPHDRELLELSGLLHDIGEHVSRDGHSRHTAYLIENGGLRGFSPDEILLLACVGRYHTRGRPRESFPAWDSLSASDRSRCLALLSLLRIADGLDVSKASLVHDVQAEVTHDTVELVAICRGDAELEQWMFQRKKGLFEELFGRTLTLRCVSAGHDEFEPMAAGGTGLG
ncbi:MAG TPA: Ppx/GppA phosphatase family protein, partial [Acidimicrobiales bacterium]|nr:Ppx/GppA phosphatase family protein [Acidimicrobiales bacterium]